MSGSVYLEANSEVRHVAAKLLCPPRHVVSYGPKRDMFGFI